MPCPKQNHRSKHNGHGVPCPYNTERKQVQDRNAGLKRKSNRSPSALSRRNEVCDPSSASVIR